MPKKPVEETKTYQRRKVALLKRKSRKEALTKRREVARQASKLAVQTVAEEAFGEGGLTPERQQALEAVLLGPDGGKLTINSAGVLKGFIARAKRKFNEHADKYVDIHLQSVQGAFADGEFDVAARHAEWAMEAFGSEVETRVAEPASKMVVAPAAPPAPIMVGVTLGGVTKSAT